MRRGRHTCAVRPRHGAALIEALVASVILAIGGVALIALLGQTSRTMSDVARAEREAVAAGRLLSRVTVLSAADVRGLVGEHREGPFTLRVARLSAALYHVAVVDAGSGATLLETRVALGDSLLAGNGGQ